MILTDKARKHRSITKSREATSNISRPTRRSLPLLNLSNRNRRVRAEFIGVGEVKLIKHNITNNENPALSNGAEELKIKHKVRHKITP